MVKRGNHAVSGLFVFLLLGLFGLLSVFMVLMGAGVYRGIVRRSEEHGGARILPAVVRGAVRSGDGEGAVRVLSEAGCEVLAVYAEYDGETYVTRLYARDGMLLTSFTEAENEFDPEEGEPLCEALSFTPRIEGNSAVCSWTDAEGQTHETRAALDAAGEEARP